MQVFGCLVCSPSGHSEIEEAGLDWSWRDPGASGSFQEHLATPPQYKKNVALLSGMP